jgi:hypothetical protein
VAGAAQAPTAKKPASVTGEWKVKDNAMDLEVGTIASSELKSVNVLIRMKKDEKPDYPVVLKALLKFNDRVLSESAPLTLLTKAPKAFAVGDEDQATAKASPTPSVNAPASPKANSTPSANAQPAATQEP